MDPYRLYIQQSHFDGKGYTIGETYDTYKKWNIVCADSPNMPFGGPKDVVSRNWLDEDGEDVYLPKSAYLNKTEVEYTFLCTGTRGSVRQNIKSFLEFLLGRNAGAVGCRLAIVDSFNSIGWKDMRVKSYSSDAYLDVYADDTVVKFKVSFDVFDPATELEIEVDQETGSVNILWGD